MASDRNQKLRDQLQRGVPRNVPIVGQQRETKSLRVAYQSGPLASPISVGPLQTEAGPTLVVYGGLDKLLDVASKIYGTRFPFDDRNPGRWAPACVREAYELIKAVAEFEPPDEDSPGDESDG